MKQEKGLGERIEKECILGFERENHRGIYLLKNKKLNDVSQKLERSGADFDKLRLYIVTSYGREIRYGQRFPELKPDERLVAICCDKVCSKCDYLFGTTKKKIRQYAHQV